MSTTLSCREGSYFKVSASGPCHLPLSLSATTLLVAIPLTMSMGHPTWNFYLEFLHFGPLKVPRYVSVPDKNATFSIKLPLTNRVWPYPVISFMTCVPSRNDGACALASLSVPDFKEVQTVSATPCWPRNPVQCLTPRRHWMCICIGYVSQWTNGHRNPLLKLKIEKQPSGYMIPPNIWYTILFSELTSCFGVMHNQADYIRFCRLTGVGLREPSLVQDHAMQGGGG